jgi:hypothetical protein
MDCVTQGTLNQPIQANLGYYVGVSGEMRYRR